MSIMQQMQSMEHSQCVLMQSQQYSHASEAPGKLEWGSGVVTVGEDGQDLSACEQQLCDLKLNDKPFICRIFFKPSNDSRAVGLPQIPCAERTSMELEMDFRSICNDEEYCEAIKSDIVHAVKNKAYGCYLYGHGSYFELRRSAS
mmetsp:Transcript_10354/g.23674  ORF Transcript_10354/g.23674 Transcript_10354/m.23674 type:complete len:145 (-) Transcript_10354:2631-3065(-)